MKTFKEFLAERKMNIKNQIRDELGHGTGSCKVRISRDGTVTYYGSLSDTDRSQDFWHEAGTVSEWEKKLSAALVKRKI